MINQPGNLADENFIAMLANSKNSRIIIPADIAQDERFHAITIRIRDYWLIAQEWLIKLEWDSKWKISAPRQLQEALKPRGVLLQQYYNLCTQCHAKQEAFDIEISYKNAGVWLQKILTELIAEELSYIVYPPSTRNNNIKKTMLDVERSKSGAFRRGINPFKEYFTKDYVSEEYLKPLGLYLLVEASLELVAKSNIFKKRHWNPLLKAYSEHIKELNSSRWGRGYIESVCYMALKHDEQTDRDYLEVLTESKYLLQGGRGEGGKGRKIAQIKLD